MADTASNGLTPQGNKPKGSWWSRLPVVIRRLTQTLLAITGLLAATAGAIKAVESLRGHQQTSEQPGPGAVGDAADTERQAQEHRKQAEAEADAAKKADEQQKKAEAERQAQEHSQLVMLQGAFPNLRGTWSYVRDTSKVQFDQEFLGHCEVSTHFESHLTFDSLDEGSRTISGSFHVEGSASADYSPPNKPDLDYSEQMHNCANAATQNMYEADTSYKSEGPITVAFDDLDASDPSVEWNPESCRLNSETCQDSGFQKRALGDLSLNNDAGMQLRVGKRVYKKD